MLTLRAAGGSCPARAPTPAPKSRLPPFLRARLLGPGGLAWACLSASGCAVRSRSLIRPRRRKFVIPLRSPPGLVGLVRKRTCANIAHTSYCCLDSSLHLYGIAACTRPLLVFLRRRRFAEECRLRVPPKGALPCRLPFRFASRRCLSRTGGARASGGPRELADPHRRYARLIRPPARSLLRLRCK